MQAILSQTLMLDFKDKKCDAPQGSIAIFSLEAKGLKLEEIIDTN
jgi:hypothetical protein